MEQFGGGFRPPASPTPGTHIPAGLPSPETPSQPPQPHGGPGVLPIRGVGFCAAMLIGSFGLWGFAWVWHTAQEVSPRVRRAAGEDTWSPGTRTGLLWVPIVGLVVVYQSWRDISRFAVQAGTRGFSAGGYLAGFIIVNLLPFVSILSVGFLWIVQERLNDAWRAVDPQRVTDDAPMMRADWITLGIGLAVWASVFIVVAAKS